MCIIFKNIYNITSRNNNVEIDRLFFEFVQFAFCTKFSSCASFGRISVFTLTFYYFPLPRFLLRSEDIAYYINSRRSHIRSRRLFNICIVPDFIWGLNIGVSRNVFSDDCVTDTETLHILNKAIITEDILAKNDIALFFWKGDFRLQKTLKRIIITC